MPLDPHRVLAVVPLSEDSIGPLPSPPPRSCPPASNSHVFRAMSGITVTLATKPALVSKPHLLHHKFKQQN